jgi:hypothetical protein
MKIRLPYLVVLSSVLGLALAACVGGAGGRSPRTGTIEHPTGDDLVLSVGYSGGHVMVEMVARQMPYLVILGDGRVIRQGAQTLEFPGPAVPFLEERTLTEEGLQEVLRAVTDTDLFNGDLELRGAAAMVADAADTVFTLHAGGTEATVVVYGLGTLEGVQPLPQGISAAEQNAHRVLNNLNNQLTTIDTWLSSDAWEREGWQPYYEPHALRLYVRDATGEPEGDLPGRQLEWPTDQDPATVGEEEEFFGNGTRCVAIEGELAQTWWAALQEANELTRWTDDGGETQYAISARQLLPYEEVTCPELGAGPLS